MIQINRIALTLDFKVKREWKENEDGSWTWRRRIDSIWSIEHHNNPEPSRKPMYSLQGSRWRASDHSVTLDDFVFLQDKAVYVHLGTGQYFTARHINALIFRDKSTWPHNLVNGRVKPTSFLRRNSRVTQQAELNNALSLIVNVKSGEKINAQQAA